MPQNPSETELMLLKALWREGRMSAREVHDATEAQTGWSFSATRKTLERMEGKGLIRVEPLHGVKTYLPQAEKLDVMARLIQNFASRILDTEGPLPAAAFTGSRVLDKDEIGDLEMLLAELSKEDEA
ncbi:BlaI/MecI/CopY family transcriptional regulator [Parvularcula sp. ZS-1/3]|uniref:BlaI/MecI/CopY family transcriptional regulator n=1 Tax=Parvularcula mediterranea TaxID=2732508 RepID=A0A7Y3W635_9PROT|nr:BlaI/MecI/CopY family transcriptional regulator [Parvularcula mediterranea]NNU16957.1 BlaI/MecI/CopY family transcriptional regulator [Parvularcula mediterranea]